MTKLFLTLVLFVCPLAYGKYRIVGFTETQESFFQPEPISNYIGNYTIQGELLEKAGTYCNSKEIENLILTNKFNRETFHEVTQRIYQCQNKLVSFFANSYLGLARKLRIDYQYEQNSKFKRLLFKDSNGHVLRAHLGIKDNHPRPLVIFKCGTDCNLGASSTREAAISLFDEGPFNILILPNFSGSAYQLDNSALGLAGFDEGLNTLEIARFVQSAEFPFSKLFSSVHLIGVSLGGYVNLYTNIYHDTEVKNGGKPFINSFFAQCPVVDLEVSLDRVFREALWRKYFIGPFLSRARIIIERVPVLKDIIGEVLDQLDHNPSAHLMSTLAVRYYKNVQSKYERFPAPFDQLQINDETDFWYYSRAQLFTDWMTSPLVIWSAEDDPVVDRYRNAEAFRAAARDRNEFGYLNTITGSHCSPIDSYGWAVSGALQRGYIKKNSPELMSRLVKREFKNQPTKMDSKFKLRKHESRYFLNWRIAVGFRQIWLRSQKLEYPCDTGELRKCTITSEAVYNLADFGINEVPNNEVEALALQRWLNANLVPVNTSGEPVQPNENIDRFILEDYLFN